MTKLSCGICGIVASFSLVVVCRGADAVLPTEMPAPASAQFRCVITSLEFTAQRRIFFGAVSAPRREGHETLRADIDIFGPPDARLELPTGMFRPDRSKLFLVLETCVDDKGQNFLSQENGRRWWLLSNPISNRPKGDPSDKPRDIRLWSLSIQELPGPSPEAKRMSLRGYIMASLSKEVKSVTLKPLADFVDKPLEVGGGFILVFTHVSGNVNYTISSPGEAKEPPPVKITFHSANGESVRESGKSMSATRYNQNFFDGFPKDGYAVVEYPVQREEVRIPLVFDHVELP